MVGERGKEERVMWKSGGKRGVGQRVERRGVGERAMNWDRGLWGDRVEGSGAGQEGWGDEGWTLEEGRERFCHCDKELLQALALCSCTNCWPH